jgi:hypothetical protein
MELLDGQLLPEATGCLIASGKQPNSSTSVITSLSGDLSSRSLLFKSVILSLGSRRSHINNALFVLVCQNEATS